MSSYYCKSGFKSGAAVYRRVLLETIPIVIEKLSFFTFSSLRKHRGMLRGKRNKSINKKIKDCKLILK
jgi:hypothetical protein